MKREHIRNYRSQDAALAAPKLGFGSSCLAPYAPYRTAHSSTHQQRLTHPGRQEPPRSDPGSTQDIPHFLNRSAASILKQTQEQSKQAGRLSLDCLDARDRHFLIAHLPFIASHHFTSFHHPPSGSSHTLSNSAKPRASDVRTLDRYHDQHRPVLCDCPHARPPSQVQQPPPERTRTPGRPALPLCYLDFLFANLLARLRSHSLLPLVLLINTSCHTDPLALDSAAWPLVIF